MIVSQSDGYSTKNYSLSWVFPELKVMERLTNILIERGIYYGDYALLQ